MFKTTGLNREGKTFDNSEAVYREIYEMLKNPKYEIKEGRLMYNNSVCYFFLADIFTRNKKVITDTPKSKLIAYIEGIIFKQKTIFK